MTPSPHDALFKAAYADPARAAAHLRATLPPEITARLDLTHLALVPGTWIEPDLSETRSDLLFTVPVLGSGEALVYLLFEHQSSPDRLMALRLLLYMARIWTRWLSEHPNHTTVPFILPLVLYHGDRGWTASRTLSHLWDLPPEAREIFAPAGAELHFQVRDLTELSDEVLRDQALDAMDLLVELLFKHGREDDLFDRLWAWSDVWQQVARSSGLRAIQLALRYIGLVQGQRPRARLRRFLIEALGSQGEEAFMTWHDEIRAEARAEALVDGQRAMFLNLLRQRFGEPSTAVAAHVAQADVDVLTTWTTRFFAAASAEELVGLT